MKIQNVPFLDAVEDVSAGNRKVPQAEFLPIGELAVVDQGRSLIAGYTNDTDAAVRAVGPLIVFGDHTRALKYVDFPFAMGADGVKVLRPREGFDPKFVYHYLRSRNIPSAGYSRHYKFLKDVSVPMFGLSEQRRIAAVLDHADALRAKRRQVLAHLDSLTQSIFHGIVGAESWPTERLGDRLDFLTSGSRGWARYYRPAGEKFIRIQNVKGGYLEQDDMAYVAAPETAEARRTRVQPGDVLLSITADLGRTAVVPEDIGVAYINQHLAILRAPSLEARYLADFLESPAGKREVLGKDRGATKAGLNFDDVRSVSIPVPPRRVQTAYASRVAQIDVQRTTQRRALVATDDLFASLQSRAFRGEL